MLSFLESYRVAEKPKKDAKAAAAAEAAKLAEEDENSKLTPSKASENEEETKEEMQPTIIDEADQAKPASDEASGDRKRPREDETQIENAINDNGPDNNTKAEETNTGAVETSAKEAPKVEQEEPDAKRAKTSDESVK